MSHTINQRMTVQVEGDFVVFLIGMRINRIWKLHKWIPVAMAMPKMLRELSLKPVSGFLGFQMLGGIPPSLFNIGDHLSNWKLMRKTEMDNIILPGKLLT